MFGRSWQSNNTNPGCGGGCGCLLLGVAVTVGLVIAGVVGAAKLVASAFVASPLLFTLLMVLLIGAGVLWWRRNVRVMRWGRSWQGGNYTSFGDTPFGRTYAGAGYQPPPAIAEDPPPSPYEILGIPFGASQEQITSAYRQMAKQYHPDRVTHLGPEFQTLAEEKMKEINAAYQALKDN